MALRFKVGDSAVLIDAESKYIGCDVEILDIDGPWDYIISINGSSVSDKGNQWACLDSQLSKLPPPDTLSSWEDCAFKPRELIGE